MRHRIPVLPQYVMPKRAMTEGAGALASSRHAGLTAAMIRIIGITKIWRIPTNAVMMPCGDYF